MPRAFLAKNVMINRLIPTQHIPTGALSVILNFGTIESVIDDRVGFCLASPSGRRSWRTKLDLKMQHLAREGNGDSTDDIYSLKNLSLQQTRTD